ncbi:unnamed protein product [Trichogramma brassicae]|uniref:Uncharacterized protein n=1 Tax=Trichogramma brassicae TaxID=86971 RepID=A0A6H5HZI6_9HYME|nr:unnamed protein product [Trichogramma brassicae]
MRKISAVARGSLRLSRNLDRANDTTIHSLRENVCIICSRARDRLSALPHIAHSINYYAPRCTRRCSWKGDGESEKSSKMSRRSGIVLVATTAAVLSLVLSVQISEAKPMKLLSRPKRVSDQRLAELETLIALSKMRGKMITIPVGFGKIDPMKIGRKRRSPEQIEVTQLRRIFDKIRPLTENLSDDNVGVEATNQINAEQRLQSLARLLSDKILSIRQNHCPILAGMVLVYFQTFYTI